MEPHRQGCALPSGVPRLTSLPAAAQVQALKLGCRDEQGEEGRCLMGSSAQTGQRRRALRQGGHRVAQGLSREIFTLSKGAQRSERIASLCWKPSADSPPPPKTSRLAEGNARLGGEAAGVGEDGRQAAREQAQCPCIDKYQTSKSIFKSGPDLECLRTAIQAKPVSAVPWVSRKSRFRSTCVRIQSIFIC